VPKQVQRINQEDRWKCIRHQAKQHAKGVGVKRLCPRLIYQEPGKHRPKNRKQKDKKWSTIATIFIG
jgi:hypothetical protein